MDDFSPDSTTDVQDPDLAELLRRLTGGGVAMSASGPPPFRSAGPSVMSSPPQSQNVPLPPGGVGALPPSGLDSAIASAGSGNVFASGSNRPINTPGKLEMLGGGSIDWSKLGEMQLNSKLAELEAKFPRGLRSDRPYSEAEATWHDPGSQLTGEYGPVKGQRPMLRNPITGGPVPASPFVTPGMLAAAANTLVEAKARARAEIINGQNTNDAAVAALSHAFGIDPTSMKGLPLELAGRMLPHIAQINEVEKSKADRAQQMKSSRAEQQTAMQQINPQAAGAMSGISDPSIAHAAFQEALAQGALKEKADAAQQKADLAEQNKNNISGAMSDLMDMDPERAAAEARTRLAQFMDTRGAHYATLIGQFDTRAQQARVAQANQQKAAQAEQQKETLRAQKQYDLGGKPLEAAIGAVPVSVKKPKPTGLGGEAQTTDQYDVNFHPAILKQLSNLRMYAANERESDPQFDDKFAQAVEMAKARMPGGNAPRWMSDPKQILEGSDPLDDPHAELSHTALMNIAMALRALRSQRPQ